MRKKNLRSAFIVVSYVKKTYKDNITFFYVHNFRGQYYYLLCSQLTWATGKIVAKGSLELDRHDVVEDWINGAVHVDHRAGEEQEPEVHILVLGEAVVDDHHSVRHPERSESQHHYHQHANHLWNRW